MILKFRVNGAWRFIDRVTEIDILDVKDGGFFEGAKIVVQYKRKNEMLSQPMGEEAYLLNDEGKTLQILVRTLSEPANT